MKPGTTVQAVDPNGFRLESCATTGPCTVDDLMESVIGHLGSFWAHMHVDAADEIDSVTQSAY